ncbi:putative DNA helicase [Mycoplasmopsis californica HAZ160_1]|uniref:DNA helicase n=1 Tax=Mycoplasmopsis californica HAZ160_1 TaxID=1397850 RepID=A0AAT9F8Q8_9BACT|nr:hypothetical protein [Mycoplasmopsis californica]BAP01286.1 putative DNA helicase [Mycoplasmopsis californica HAZ160_1]BBG41160.1 putative DNA helicase [Mycoplasmopsis californica]BBG41753.1 putative DNA helicase [Mycoplasmopsis californica]BBG42347.1 putative DNA helicase [Mycoplasmopsis californica]BBG42922.1 putative DNA helicase [Mycoplasmopsis californica]
MKTQETTFDGIIIKDVKQYRELAQKVAKSSKPFLRVMADLKITWDEFDEHCDKLLELKDILDAPNNFPYKIEVKRDRFRKLQFSKTIVDNNITKNINLINHLWLSDIANVRTNLEISKTAIISVQQKQLESRIELLKQSLLQKSHDFHVKNLFIVNKKPIHSASLGQAIAINFAKEKINSAYITTNTLFNHLKKGFNDPRNNNVEIINKLKEVDILVINDLGNEQASAWFLFDVISEIIKARIEANKPNIIFSTLLLEELKNYYSKHRVYVQDAHKVNYLINFISETSIEFQI